MKKTLIEKQEKWLTELEEENLSLKLKLELVKIEIAVANRGNRYD